MLALIETRTQNGYGPVKVISRKVVNITGRRFNKFKSESKVYIFSKENVYIDTSPYGSKLESCIRALNPKQSLGLKFPESQRFIKGFINIS
jgi:hypothetical protein